MAKKTNKGLVAYVKIALAQGWVYWYGTTGLLCTEDLLKRKAKQYPAHYTEARMPKYRKHIAEGRYCADCINLIKGYMWLDEATGRQAYASNGCPDTNANGMFAKAKTKGPIATIPEIPGVIVRKEGHAGVYIGNGEVIEAMGFAYGVVKTKLSRGAWTHWYYMPGLDYEVDETTTTITDDTDASGCPYPEPEKNVSYGAKGPGVRWLQWVLHQLGYDLGKYGIDGDYGGYTRKAVIQFQSIHGLTQDAIVGPMTKAALKQALADLENKE